jgi:intracellular septation protein
MENQTSNNTPQSSSGFNWVRLVSDLGPALAFFIGYSLAPKFFPADPITHNPKPILVATFFFLPASIAAFAFSWVKTRKVSPIGVFTFVMLLIMSALGILLNNDIFIKMRPTLVYAAMGLILLVSVMMGRNVLRTLFDGAMHMPEDKWSLLSFSAGIMYVILAIINEIVWRNLPEKTWVLYNMWGDFAINILFWIIAMALLSKHLTDENGKPLLEQE